MDSATELGLMMLTSVIQRPVPRYHDMADDELEFEQRFLRREIKFSKEYVADCKQALIEAGREHKWNVEQLDCVSGILETRELNRSDAR